MSGQQDAVGRILAFPDQIENLLLYDPISRVVHYLMKQAETRATQTESGLLLEMPVKDLPKRLGLRKEQVDDAVAKLVKTKLISLAPEGFVVKELSKLTQYLEFLEMKEKFGG